MYQKMPTNWSSPIPMTKMTENTSGITVPRIPGNTLKKLRVVSAGDRVCGSDD